MFGGPFDQGTDDCSQATVTSMDNADDVVGYYTSTAGPRVFERFPNGSFETWAPKGGSAARYPYITINSATGMIVGSYESGTPSVLHGFVIRPGGGFSTLDVPKAVATAVGGSNGSGQIVGSYARKNGAGGCYVFESGAFHYFTTPCGSPTGINDNGTVIGVQQNSIYLFVQLPDGTFLTVDGMNTLYAVNNFNEIAAYTPHLTGGPVLRVSKNERKVTTRVYADPSCGSGSNIGWVAVNDAGLVGGVLHCALDGRIYGYLQSTKP